MPTLVKCPACGRDVSDAATSCPHCGQPLRQQMTPAAGGINMSDPVHVIGVVVAVIILVVFVGGLVITILNR